MQDERTKPENQPLPGSVGDNGEEQPSPAGGGETRRKPSESDGNSSGGEASEGSQSTGDPNSAG